MRRAILKTAVMAVAVLVISSGVALAVTGTNGNDTIKGTPGTDRQAGGGGNDKIYGKGGKDFQFGDQGANGMNDTMYGGDDDFINAADGTDGDVVDGGSGNETNGDTCVVDPGDRITSSTTGNPLVNVPSGIGSAPPVDPTGTTCENITVVGQ